MTTKFCTMMPNICVFLSMEFVSCHHSVAYNFEVAPTFSENLYTPVKKAYCIGCSVSELFQFILDDSINHKCS